MKFISKLENLEFNEKQIDFLLNSKWWEKDIADIKDLMIEFNKIKK